MQYIHDDGTKEGHSFNFGIMAVCFRCGKPVYFAERTVASGKEWHRRCFTCTQCGKILHPGRHSEHKGLPYCDIPCYCALFGPHLYHQGVGGFEFISTIPPVTTMTDPMAESTTTVPELETKLKAYNDYFAANAKQQITEKYLDNKQVLEGQLRVYWGIQSPICFRQKDESHSVPKFRHHSCFVPVTDDYDVCKDVPKCNGTSDSVFASQEPSDADVDHNVYPDGVVMRRHYKKRRSTTRLSVINGHMYDAETSVFVPWHGSVTVVTVTSLDDCSRTIRLLLDKFKVENCAEEYCLCVNKCSGETQTLSDSDLPLLTRLFFGPLEDDAKIFIVERQHTVDITKEVAEYINLPEAVLSGFLNKCFRDEERDIQWIQEKYDIRRRALEDRMLELCRC